MTLLREWKFTMIGLLLLVAAIVTQSHPVVIVLIAVVVLVHFLIELARKRAG